MLFSYQLSDFGHFLFLYSFCTQFLQCTNSAKWDLDPTICAWKTPKDVNLMNYVRNGWCLTIMSALWTTVVTLMK